MSKSIEDEIQEVMGQYLTFTKPSEVSALAAYVRSKLRELGEEAKYQDEGVIHTKFVNERIEAAVSRMCGEGE